MLVFVCLLDDLIVGFCWEKLTRKTGGLELASTIIVVLQANRLTKCASHPIRNIAGNTFNITDEYLVNLLLFVNGIYTEIDNSHIINATIKYLLDSERFSEPLLQNILILIMIMTD